ncbi:hypothetical protein QE152_g37859 [Popillia japonica]|uniref:Uncharacterized protein n=1 Tax=Popillia japonica TaxID=7064 RepID=A0AAW1I8Q0_POPJA
MAVFDSAALERGRLSLLESNKTRQTKDELDLIFLGYAASVRKLNPERQGTMKYRIAKFLMEEELQQLNETLIHSRSSTSLSSSSADYGSNTTPMNDQDSNLTVTCWYENFQYS